MRRFRRTDPEEALLTTGETVAEATPRILRQMEEERRRKEEDAIVGPPPRYPVPRTFKDMAVIQMMENRRREEILKQYYNKDKGMFAQQYYGNQMYPQYPPVAAYSGGMGAMYPQQMANQQQQQAVNNVNLVVSCLQEALNMAVSNRLICNQYELNRVTDYINSQSNDSPVNQFKTAIVNQYGGLVIGRQEALNCAYGFIMQLINRVRTEINSMVMSQNNFAMHAQSGMFAQQQPYGYGYGYGAQVPPMQIPRSINDSFDDAQMEMYGNTVRDAMDRCEKQVTWNQNMNNNGNQPQYNAPQYPTNNSNSAQVQRNVPTPQNGGEKNLPADIEMCSMICSYRYMKNRGTATSEDLEHLKQLEMRFMTVYGITPTPGNVATVLNSISGIQNMQSAQSQQNTGTARLNISTGELNRMVGGNMQNPVAEQVTPTCVYVHEDENNISKNPATPKKERKMYDIVTPMAKIRRRRKLEYECITEKKRIETESTVVYGFAQFIDDEKTEQVSTCDISVIDPCSENVVTSRATETMLNSEVRETFDGMIPKNTKRKGCVSVVEYVEKKYLKKNPDFIATCVNSCLSNIKNANDPDSSELYSMEEYVNILRGIDCHVNEFKEEVVEFILDNFHAYALVNLRRRNADGTLAGISRMNSLKELVDFITDPDECPEYKTDEDAFANRLSICLYNSVGALFNRRHPIMSMVPKTMEDKLLIAVDKDVDIRIGGMSGAEFVVQKKYDTVEGEGELNLAVNKVTPIPVERQFAYGNFDLPDIPKSDFTTHSISDTQVEDVLRQLYELYGTMPLVSTADRRPFDRPLMFGISLDGELLMRRRDF